jgi:hypothetical protein
MNVHGITRSCHLDLFQQMCVEFRSLCPSAVDIRAYLAWTIVDSLDDVGLWTFWQTLPIFHFPIQFLKVACSDFVIMICRAIPLILESESVDFSPAFFLPGAHVCSTWCTT